MVINPSISIIIVNYNGYDFLTSCLKSLNSLTYRNFEVIVVDNNIGENLGFARGNNAGVDNAEGEYLLFLNNDTKVAPDLLKRLVEALDDSIGVYAPLIYTYDGKEEFRIGRCCDRLGWQGWEGPIFFAEGSALFIHRDLFYKLGGFDNSYFMFLEDIDLCWRVQLLGLKIKPVYKARVYHFSGGSASGGRGSDGEVTTTLCKRYHGEKNQLRSILKNYGSKEMVVQLLNYLKYQICEMCFVFLTNRFSWFLVYLKADLWNLLNLPDTLRERRKIQAMRVVSDREIQSKMLKFNAKWDTYKRIGIPKIRRQE